MKLTQKTILITGGSSGIGLELARQLQARGNTIIITGRDQHKLDAAQRELPGLHMIRSDVSEPNSITALHAHVTAQFPALDTLINNAGIMRNLNLHDDHGLIEVTREVEVNLMGPVRMIQQFLPHLKTRPEALIVNVSSGLAFVPYPISPIYSATKAALHSYTQSLRIQLEGTGVRVVELAPPATETPLLRGEFDREMQGQRVMDVKVLVKQTLAGIEGGRVDIRPGLSNVMSAMGRIAPGFMLRQLANSTRPKN
ncbi:SDR family oxidoreductase [Deinococcus hopiensis]|uniref:Uncharacterized oxidoreductase n=1 Tax=Deinococcus hopiensis KR-140 TaxID=695939 RepID=A0A1W1ULD4_9DEIO|nr:SDR family NAD(P)-dependent oxidoreductase [Deinococcus hopiensis]SMB81554.1 uncharacterized oxidoreductase [Deinococcus hopiensis KR-140]